MQIMGKRRVVVVYTHPLFGLGIAHLLQNDGQLQVSCLKAALPEVGEQLRRLRPHAIVLEGREEDIYVRDLTRGLPRALIILVRLEDDVMDAYYGRQVVTACPETLVKIIHRGRPPSQSAG
jgi:DNA-binding NarL/FixJ family response regulator